MKIEILGSGGSIVTPRPGCYCESCVKARTYGAPFVRTGPSVFIHDYSILIDTPEDISVQLNRSKIDTIDHCLYSHWHGDHVLGRRIWYTLNYDFVNKNPVHRKTIVHLTETEEIDFRNHLGHLDHFKKLENEELIQLSIEKNNKPFFIEDLKIQPYPLADKSVFAFLFKEGGKQIGIAMDDLYRWKPSVAFNNLDLLILPIGIFDSHPMTGKQLMDPEHHLLKGELTFKSTLALLKKLNPKRVVFMHIEEHDQISFESLGCIGKKFSSKRCQILCSYDGMTITI